MHGRPHVLDERNSNNDITFWKAIELEWSITSSIRKSESNSFLSLYILECFFSIWRSIMGIWFIVDLQKIYWNEIKRNVSCDHLYTSIQFIIIMRSFALVIKLCGALKNFPMRLYVNIVRCTLYFFIIWKVYLYGFSLIQLALKLRVVSCGLCVSFI